MVVPTPDKVIAAHLAWMTAAAFSPNTVAIATWVLHTVNKALHPHGLTGAYPEELTTWLARTDWTPATRAAYRAHLRRFYRWATSTEDPWLSYDPSIGLRRPTVRPGTPRPATNAQVRVAINRTPAPHRLHCRLAAYGGLRCIEIARLDRADVTETHLYVHGKGGVTKAVPTHPLVWEVVAGLPPGPVTVRPDGRPATATWVSHATAYQLRRLDLPISLHQLRHWYGTMVQRRYRDLRVTQEMLRHSSPVATAIYTQVTDESMREASECLPDLSDDD